MKYIIVTQFDKEFITYIPCNFSHAEIYFQGNVFLFQSPDRRPTTLVVTDLPTHKSVVQIRTLLRKLSQNCGGKVSEVRGSKAFIKFATPDATER